MSKYTVTLTATSVKTFDIEAHSGEEAIAIMNDIRDHTDMLSFTEADVTDMIAAAEPAVSTIPPAEPYDDEDNEDEAIVDQIHTAATDLRFSLQMLLDSIDALGL